MHSLKITYQIMIIIMIWYVIEQLLRYFNISLPASILGLFGLLFLLKKNVLAVQSIEYGGNFLLKHMILFFIPPVVGLVQYKDILLKSGIQIFIAIFISTIMVMYSSKLTVKFLLK